MSKDSHVTGQQEKRATYFSIIGIKRQVTINTYKKVQFIGEKYAISPI